MLDMLKKAFWVPYEDGSVYPTVPKAHQAIARYCEANGWSCSFPSDDEAVIDGKTYEIYRGYETGSRGNYGVKCREK